MAVTPDRMHDARDAEDAFLLETGDHATLIAAWYPVIVQRCLVRARDSGYDVAHDVVERLLAELRRGRRYPVPYRIVVHMVVKWTIQEHFQGLPTDGPLPDGWDAGAAESGFGRFEARYDLEQLFDGLPDGDRAVCKLRYIDGLEIPEIAERLDKKPNAIYQSLHRAHVQLKELADAA